MFLCSLLPSCSGHRLSRCLEVPENCHCTCLEQLLSFGMHCPMHSETDKSWSVSRGYQLCIALARGLMCQCLLCKDSFVPPDKLWMHSPTHMSDFQTCYPQPYFLGKSFIVCSMCLRSSDLKAPDEHITLEEVPRRKSLVYKGCLFTLLKPILAVIWEESNMIALKKCLPGLKWICEYHLKSWEGRAQRLDLPALTKTMKEV